MRIDSFHYLLKFSCLTITAITCFFILLFILWGYLKASIQVFNEIFVMKGLIKALYSGFYHPEFQLRLYMTINIFLIINYHYPFYYPTGVFYLFEDYYTLPYYIWDKEEHVFTEIGYTAGSKFLTPCIYDVYTKNGWVNSVLTNYF